MQDHLFISYATEQVALADWLARRLAARGYAVWYDRLKLLGGEPWPQDIDDAIKNRTFRMLALLSHASLKKPNPTGERTTAQQISRERNIPDFLIPLNVEGLRPTDITWNLSHVNYIEFTNSWAQGLADVVKKLEAIGAPKVLADGQQLAASTLSYSDYLRDESEVLCTNCFAVLKIPEVINRFAVGIDIGDSIVTLQRRWPFRRVASDRLLAFVAPPPDIQQKYRIVSAGGACWRCMPSVDGIPSRDLVVSLIHIAIEAHMAQRGLVFSEDRRQWYVPSGLLAGDWLRFERPDGTAGRVLAVGERTFRSGSNREPYRYHLSPSFSVLRGSEEPFVLVLRNRVFLSNTHGAALEGRKVTSRRKHLCKNWWNDDWLARALGVGQLLATHAAEIRIGSAPDNEIVIGSTPITMTVPVRLDETGSELPDMDFIANHDDDYDTEGEE